jgi:predicted Rossmann fold nucleotide-binding protein DprA/Smf involved in DNA uptake
VFGLGPLALDELVPRSGLPVERVLAALTRLELSGLVGRCGGGWSHSRAGR